jgi:hypothetical protein
VEELLETLVVYAFLGLLILLRLDTRRFSAAEHDDEDAGGMGIWLRRLSWYAFGIGLIVLIYRLYPLPISELHLQLGDDRGQAIVLGLSLGALGTLVALGWAYLRLGGTALPPVRRYPAGVLNSVCTAFIDEAAFRGIMLGLMLAADWPVELAIGIQAVLYGLITRLAARDRPIGMLLLSLAIGAIGGWLTVLTGGIGASFLGHALTRFALFVSTGHAGLVHSPAEEEPPPDAEELTPEGWEIVSDRGPGNSW